MTLYSKVKESIQNIHKHLGIETNNIIRGHKFIQYSLANLKLGWPLVKLYTFQSTGMVFNYMLRKSSNQLGDPMDGIVIPEKWQHLCVAMDGTTNIVRGVSVSKHCFYFY